jgi:hypothetical protein
MTTSKRIFSSCFSGLAIISCAIGTAFAQEDEIVGTWTCGLSIEDPASGAAVTAEFETSYDSDGSYTRAGQLNISVAAAQLNVSVVLDEAGNWRLVDAMSLGETVTEIDFTSTAETPSPIEQMMLQQMEAESNGVVGQEEVSEITSLTANSMEIESSDGAAMVCQKA